MIKQQIIKLVMQFWHKILKPPREKDEFGQIESAIAASVNSQSSTSICKTLSSIIHATKINRKDK